MNYDLISRQAAIDALTKLRIKKIRERKDVSLVWECLDKVMQVPSAQPEIIRCKDCKHYEIWQLKSDYTDDKRYKPSVCVLGRYAAHRPEDWYCADAERRTDETD